MDELLAKYLLGEASKEEIQAIEAWVKASSDNQKHFNHFKLIWETSKLLKIESKLDPDELWAEFKQMTQNTGNKATRRSMFFERRWMQIAAIALVLCIAGGVLYTALKPSKVNMLTLQSAGQVRTGTLPDGSVITLNKYSSIVYPDKFTGNTREIKLARGEAFFNIEHDKTKPFLIHVNDAIVQVLGTSFNIKTGNGKAEVIVETGIVQVIRNKVAIRLQPAEKVDIDYQSGGMKKGQSTDQLYNYYRTKKLVANKTPLWRVVEVLNEVYKANIVIADKKLAGRTLTTTFDISNPLDRNLQIISETFNVKIVRKAGRIIIQ
ncbi:FecR domain-containing protein [Mucilaginibacter sp. AW1-3]